MNELVTIRKDQALNNLAALLGKRPESLIAYMKKRITSHHDMNNLLDLPEVTGKTVWSVIEDYTGHDDDVSCLWLLGKDTPDIRRWYLEILFWGSDDDCPDCGCEEEIEECTTEGDNVNEPRYVVDVITKKCTNCGWIY